MKTTKIVFIGAGSMSFGLSMFRDLFSTTELSGSELVLVDLDPLYLERMYNLAEFMNARTGAGYIVSRTVDRRAALPGAGFVVNSIAIERNRLWKHDFAVPKKYGVRHTLGENGGPGGLFFTLRTIPAIIDIVRDMEELCPEAVFINFSNPESRIIYALGKYSRIRSIGLCHGVFMGQHDVARITGLEPDDVDALAAGLNHFQWFLQIRRHSTGEDLYPLLRAADQTYDPAFMPLTRRLMRSFSLYPSCSDDHIGEYLAYGWEGGEEGYDFEQDDYNRLALRSTIDGVLAGAEPPADFFQPSGERGVAVISGMVHNKKTLIESGVVYNRGAISNLPYDCAVEVPVVVDAKGIHPCAVGPLPGGIAALCSVQVHIQQMSVEAAMRGDKMLALQTLLIDPVIHSSTAAEQMLKELWEINQPYIRSVL
ncbi:MAG TPA: alpha-glucosidase/alpha-galactosidase [Levilinea sp.]|nr:alpha-glucosidase/alpha-galactosidase [Levilinea sp.]